MRLEHHLVGGYVRYIIFVCVKKIILYRKCLQFNIIMLSPLLMINMLPTVTDT